MSRLNDDDLGRVVEYQFGDGEKHSMPLGELRHHAAIHAVRHRGQVALLLRAFGFGRSVYLKEQEEDREGAGPAQDPAIW